MDKKKVSKKQKSNSFTKTKIATGLAAICMVASGILWLSFGPSKKFPVPATTVNEVVDGDTFYTSDGLAVRLASINAPERGVCGYDVAKEGLEKMVLNKKIFLKSLDVDAYRRNVALVYTDAGLINEKMISQGFAVYYPYGSGFEELRQTEVQAKKNKKNIFGPLCTQEKNYENPACNIKGNISNSSGKITKTYVAPSCRYYDRTQVQLYMGDMWFCSETEARKAGFKKPEQCEQREK